MPGDFGGRFGNLNIDPLLEVSVCMSVPTNAIRPLVVSNTRASELEASINAHHSLGTLNLTRSKTAHASFVVTYRLEMRGEYQVDVLLSGEHIGNSPYTLTVAAPLVSAEHCTVTGAAVQTVCEGHATYASLVCRSVRGTALWLDDAVAIDARLVTADGGHSIVGRVVVKHSANIGEYELQFSVQQAGTWTLDVRVLGSAVAGRPLTVDVKPALACSSL